MKKVLIELPHFAPYRDETFKELRKKNKFEFLFLVTSGNKTHPEWEYRNPDFNFIEIDETKIYKNIKGIHLDYIKALKEFKPDIVILYGGFSELIYTHFFYSNINIIFSADTSRLGKNGKKIWNKLLLKFIYNCADGIYVPGIKSKKYFMNYIKDESRIKMGSYTNDVKIIKERYSSYNREVLRKKWKIKQTDYVFLFVGKLIKDRKIYKIINIAKKIHKQSNIKFLIVGNGPDEEIVKNYIKKYSNLIYIPSIPLNELESVYLASDAYLYLGWEPYSLALYEAAILGKPIIATKEIGAMYDCVRHLENGYAITDEKEDEIIEIINQTSKGKFHKGAIKMKNFIECERGVPWAAEQLEKLMESKGR